MIVQRARFPWSYLLLAYSLAWIFWIPLALTGRDYQSSPWLILLFLLGVFGPGLAVIMTYSEGGREGGRAFWHRVFDFRRIRPLCYGIILHTSSNLCLDLSTEPGTEQRLFLLLAIIGAIVIAVIWAFQMRSYPQKLGQEVSR